MPSLVIIRSLSVSICFIFGLTTVQAQNTDSLVCDKDFSDLSNTNFKIALRREATGTFSVKAGDSIRYSVFREKKHKANFTIYDSKGTQVLTKALNVPVITEKIEPAIPGNYFFKIKSKSLLSNSFIVTVQRKGCTYVKKVIPVPPAPPVYKTDTTITVKIDSTIYLASKLNLKNKQRISIPVDSLQGTVVYEIRSTGGPVKYRFINSGQQAVKQGVGELNTGQLHGERRGYSLWLENDDKVVGKHVYINVKQILYSRTLLEQK